MFVLGGYKTLKHSCTKNRQSERTVLGRQFADLNRKTRTKKRYLGWLWVLCYRKTQISTKTKYFSRAKLLEHTKKLKMRKSDFPFKSSINFCISYKHFTFEMAWFAATMFCKKRFFENLLATETKKTKISLFSTFLTKNVFFLMLLTITP